MLGFSWWLLDLIIPAWVVKLGALVDRPPPLPNQGYIKYNTFL